jgi:hypothetical protein
MQFVLKRTIVSVVGAFILLVAFPLAGFAQSAYFDNFEAPTFNPFWTLVQQKGTIALSTDQSYSGIQSAKLTGTGGGQVNVWLEHTFPQSQLGTTSVWWYDTVSNNIYSGLYMFNAGVEIGSLGVVDNSLPLYVWFNPQTGTLTYTTVPRTLGWHHLTIQVTPTGVNFLIDDIMVGVAVGHFGFDKVRLLVSGPGETGTFYFDDFRFTPPFTVPTTKDECKDGGWEHLSHADGSPFRNQGDCVSYVNTGK